MSNHVLRNTIGSLAELANQAPDIYKMLNQVGAIRRRERATRAAHAAGWMGAGLLVGAGAAMLLSPKSGPWIRRRLSAEALRLRDYVAPQKNGAADGVIEGALS